MPAAPAHCKLYNHADAATLQDLICRASFVISRCGYTTVMDLLKLGAKGILIPTPGQAEQEYLAVHLQQQQWAYTAIQDGFQLHPTLQAAEQFNYRSTPIGTEQYPSILAAWVGQFKS
jgi:predicted glycosyltransferase